MSRETGWYRVWCRTDLCWTFREFFDGEWEDHGNYLSDRDFKIAYDVPEQTPVNPVPADYVDEYKVKGCLSDENYINQPEKLYHVVTEHRVVKEGDK